MPISLNQADLVWIQEAEARLASGKPLDPNAMLVALEDKLPRGFRVGDLTPGATRSYRPSLLGLQASGDTLKVLPDVEKAILWVQEQVRQNPQLEAVEAASLAAKLSIPMQRAEWVLDLLASIQGLSAGGGTGAPNGMQKVNIGGADGVAAYLAFRHLDDALQSEQKALQDQLALRSRREPSPIAVPIERNSAFILMSMNPSDPSIPDVFQGLKEVCAQFGLKAFRIDEVEPEGQITNKILECLSSSEFIIADLTGERPNVYYEVGYAQALGKRPILIRRAGTPLHFDLSVHKVPEYRNVTELKPMLRQRLATILGRDPLTE